jgi:hypothetical protein
MNKPESPEVLAVVPLPSAAERGRRENMLARVRLVAIDLVLSGEGLGMENCPRSRQGASAYVPGACG